MCGSQLVVGLTVLTLASAGCGSAFSGSSAPVRVESAGVSSRPPTLTAGRPELLPVLVAAASQRVVYVLGRAAGTQGSAPHLFRSDDLGRHFHRVTAPTSSSPRDGRPVLIRKLWFATPSDGYALAGAWGERGPLLVTSDGARTWHQSTIGDNGFVAAIGGRGGRGGGVYALALQCQGKGWVSCPSATLYRSRAGGLTWARAQAAGLAQVNESCCPSLAAWGASVWIMAGNGEIGSPLLLWSRDAGRSFRRAAVPAVACWLAATSPAVAWLSCSGGMMLTFDRWSSGRLARLPVTGSGTGNTFLDPVSDTGVYFGTALGASAGLHLSRDAGARFARVARLPAAGMVFDMLFLTLRTGLCWAAGGPLLRTDNGGRTWTAVRL